MHNEYLEAIINLRSQISSRFVRRFIEYGNENINYRTEPRLLFQNMVPVFRLLDKKYPDFRTLTIFVRFMAAYFPTFFEMLVFSELFHYMCMYFDQRSMDIFRLDIPSVYIGLNFLLLWICFEDVSIHWTK